MQFAAVAGTLAAAFGVLGTTAAQAQDDPNIIVPTQKKFRVKIGGYFPESGRQRDALGRNFVSFGLGYDLGKTSTTVPVVYEIYADYLRRSKTSGDFGRTGLGAFGVGLAARYFFTDANQMYKPYAGAGVGIYSIHLKQDLPTGAFSNKREIGLGGKFLLGTEMNNGIFGELEYNFLPRPSIFGNDINLNGLQLRLGYRFF